MKESKDKQNTPQQSQEPWEKYPISESNWNALKEKHGALSVVQLETEKGIVFMVMKEMDMTTLSMVTAQTAKEQHIKAAQTIMKRLCVKSLDEDHYSKNTSMVLGFLPLIPQFLKGATATLEKF